MKTIARTKAFNASMSQVFDCLDDLGVSGMHMTKSSMPMMGGKMELQFLSAQKTGLNTEYKWTGKVLGMRLDFTVRVTKWARPKEKIWETIGKPKLIIFSWFQMYLDISERGGTSTARLGIRYEKPKGLLNQLLSFFLGPWYCRWCLNNMLNDAKKKLSLE